MDCRLIVAQQAEIREQNDRMAGLVVAVVCSIASVSGLMIVWGLKCAG